MRKITILALVLVFVLAGCSAGANAPASQAPTKEVTMAPTEEPTEAPTEEAPTEEPTATPEPTEQPTAAPLGVQQGKGTLGDFDVQIVSAKLSKTYNGKQAVVIEFKWKNNSDKAANFMFAVMPKVFQNDVECENAILDMKSKVDTNAAMKDIKPGKEQTVWMAYELTDKSKIDVEVTALISFDDETKVVKTFDNLK